MSVDLDELQRVAVSEDAGVVVAVVAELRAARAVVDVAREFLNMLESNQGWHYPPMLAQRLAKCIDIAKARRE